MLKMRGYNPFYEGWLDAAFGWRTPNEVLLSSFTLAEQSGYKDGFRTALETGPLVLTVLPFEIKLGHIIVERSIEHDAIVAGYIKPLSLPAGP